MFVGADSQLNRIFLFTHRNSLKAVATAPATSVAPQTRPGKTYRAYINCGGCRFFTGQSACTVATLLIQITMGGAGVNHKGR